MILKMKIITDINNIKLNNTCVTIGKFDGFHLGHRKLLSEMDKKTGCKKVIVTFDKFPGNVLNGTKDKFILSDMEKQIMCERFGVDIYVCISMTKEFLALTAEEFITEILVGRLGAEYVIAGEDFHFGKNRLGDKEMLIKYADDFGYKASIVKKAVYKGEDISSTRIKNALVSGDIKSANDMLGYPYTIMGKIRHGKQLGRKMDLPTANIIPEADKLLPPNGVYKTVVCDENREFNAISNIGVNPTVTNDGKIKVESHILDFAGEIYGEMIEVRCCDFIRPEKKFNSMDELKAQINRDIKSINNKNS